MDYTIWLVQCFYCVGGVFMVLLGTGWIKFNLVTKIRHHFSSLQRQIDDLQLEIQQYSAELAKIPIMDQFAANRKKQRVIDKLTDNLKNLISQRDSQEMKANLVWVLFEKGLCLSTGFYLANQSADLTVLAMSSSHLYPFNFLLAYPSLTSTSDETQVSLFSFLILLFFTCKIFNQRVLAGKTAITSMSSVQKLSNSNLNFS